MSRNGSTHSFYSTSTPSGLGKSFFPSFLIDHFESNEVDAGDNGEVVNNIERPFFFRHPSSVVQINIEYTDPSKPEDIQLQELFNDLSECIANNNGDIAMISGNRVLAFWSVTKTKEAKEALLLRAATCALEASKLPSAIKENLNVSFCLSFGMVFVVIVGGFLKWKYIIVGEAIDEAAFVYDCFQRERMTSTRFPIICSRNTQEIVQTFGKCDQLPNTELYELKSVNKKISAPITSSASPICVSPQNSMANLLSQPSDKRKVYQSLRVLNARFVPEHLQQVESDSAMSKMSDLRLISIICVRFENLHFTADNELVSILEDEKNDSLQRFQFIVNSFQALVSHFGGTLYSISCVQNITTFIISFGLSPVSEDDAQRAVKVAIEIARAKSFSEIPDCTIGISTGRVQYCSLGSRHRRDMVIIGNPLVQAREFTTLRPESPIFLCDENTTKGCQKYGRKKMIFESVARVGLDMPIFQPVLVTPGNLPREQETRMFGREEEQNFLERAISELQDGQPSGIILIEGEEGMGKTMLMNHVQRYAKGQHVPCYYSAADCMEKKTSWYAWRNILLKMWGMPTLESIEDSISQSEMMAITEIAGKQLNSEPDELGYFSSLLNTVIPVHFPENRPEVNNMPALTRADKIRDMLLYFMQDPTSQPRIIIIEDLQWIDSASKNFIFFLLKRIRSNLLVILTTRELINKDDNEDFYQLATAQISSVAYKKLSPLKESSTTNIVVHTLELKIFNSLVIHFIHEKGQGNPFYCQEIALALKQSKAIEVINSRCKLNVAALAQVTYTDSIERVTRSRIDNLTVQQKHVLKAASVIQSKFEIAILRKICAEQNLNNILDSLIQLKLITREEVPTATETTIRYSFSQSVIQAVVNRNMTLHEKEHLHSQIAEYYESIASMREDPSSLGTVLAYHWGKAAKTPENIAKAVHYLEMASIKALNSNENRDAISLYLELIDIINNHGDKIEPLVKARHYRRLSEAYWQEGNLAESADYLLLALGCLNLPVPSSAAKSTSSFRHFVKQGWHSFVPKFSIVDENSKTAEGALIYVLLSSIYLYQNQKGLLVDSALQALSLATEMGPSEPLIKAYALMSVATKWSSWTSCDERYRTKAIEMAQKLNNRELEVQVECYTALRDWILGNLSSGEQILANNENDSLSSRTRATRLSIYGGILLSMGKIDLAKQQFAECINLSDEDSIALTRIIGGLGAATIAILQNEPVCAAAILDKLASIVDLDENKQNIFQSSLFHTWHAGLRALINFELGEYRAARNHCEEMLEYLDLEPIIPFMAFGLSCLARVAMLLLGEQIVSDTAELSLRDLCTTICRVYARFSKTCRFVLPARHLWKGVFRYITGNPAKAHIKWRKAIQEINRGIPVDYERTLAHHLIQDGSLSNSNVLTEQDYQILRDYIG